MAFRIERLLQKFSALAQAHTSPSLDTAVPDLSLPSLFDTLSTSESLSARVEAANSLSLALRFFNFPLSTEILDIWDLVDSAFPYPPPSALLEVDPDAAFLHYETRLLFANSCLLGQYNNTRSLRRSFFSLINTPPPPSSSQSQLPHFLALKISVLQNLTRSGKDVDQLEKDIPILLSTWLRDYASVSTLELSALLCEILEFSGNLVSLSRVTLDGSDINLIVAAICKICSVNPDPETVRSCISVLETTVKFGPVPHDSLKIIANTICVTVTVESLTRKSWMVALNILRSNAAWGFMMLLAQVLEQPNDGEMSKDSYSARFRGAVFIVELAGWGPHIKSADDKQFSFAFILSLLSKASTHKIEIADYEILLSLCRLIDTHGKQKSLTIIEWELVLSIMKNLSWYCTKYSDILSPHITTTAQQPDTIPGKIITLFNRILASTRELYVTSQSESSLTVFYDLLLVIGPILSESLAIDLIEYTSHASWHATFDDWIRNLSNVVSMFYIHDKRTVVRKQVLSVVTTVYDFCQGREREEFFGRVIMKVVENMREDTDVEVFQMTMDLIMDLARGLGEVHLLRVLDLLSECAGVVIAVGSGGDKQNLVEDRKMVRMHAGGIEFTIIAAETLVNLFSRYFTESAGTGCDVVFRILLGILVASSVPLGTRLAVWRFFSQIRADPNGRVRIPASLARYHGHTSSVSEGAKSMNSEPSSLARGLSGAKWLANPMVLAFDESLLKTANSNASLDATQMSTTATTTFVVLPMRDYVAALTLLLTSGQNHYDLITAITTDFPSQLENLHLFRDCTIQLHTLRNTICQQIRRDELLKFVQNIPQEVRAKARSDLNLAYFRVLSPLLLVYKHLLPASHQHLLEAVDAFVFGVKLYPGSTSRFCMQVLTLALYELPQIVIKRLSNILETMVRNVAGAMATSNLEFLAALAHLPELLVNFTEDDYKSIFGVAVQYIRPAAVSSISQTHTTSTIPPTISVPSADIDYTNVALRAYALQLAYHVVSLWIVQVRLSDRRKYVPWIIKTVANRADTSSPSSTTQQTSQPYDKIDENVELLLDMLTQNTFADCSPKPGPVTGLDANNENLIPNFKQQKGTATITRTWIQGYSLITIRALKQLQWAEITIRRASGVIQFWMRLENRVKNPGDRVAAMADHTTSVLPAPVAVTEVEQRKIEESMGIKPKVKWKHARSSSMGASLVDSLGEVVVEVNALQKFYYAMKVTGNKEYPLYASSGESHGLNKKRSLSLSSRSKSDGGSQSSITKDEVTPRSTSQSSSTTTTPRTSLVGMPPPQSRTVNPREENLPNIDPSFVMLQLNPYPELQNEAPYLLGDDDATSRAISVLDRTPIVDLHKIGVIYVGPHQTQESEILNNKTGSRTYNLFLQTLGQYVRLKGCRHVNTGGLDTTADLDGQYAIYEWQDDLSQIIFHTTSMMPSNPEIDPLCTAKKRHIGNDYVLIVWNESGRDYAFDTIPGQFNFINIVVTPMDADISVLAGRWPTSAKNIAAAAAGATVTNTQFSDVESNDSVIELPPPVRFYPVDVFVPGSSVNSTTSGGVSDTPSSPFESTDFYGTPTTPPMFGNSVSTTDSFQFLQQQQTQQQSQQPSNFYFKVSIQQRRDIPELGMLRERILNSNHVSVGSGHVVVSSTGLPAFVRQLAVQSNSMAQIYMQTKNTGGKLTSNARERLEQIKRIKMRRKGDVDGLDFTTFT